MINYNPGVNYLPNTDYMYSPLDQQSSDISLAQTVS